MLLLKFNFTSNRQSNHRKKINSLAEMLGKQNQKKRSQRRKIKVRNLLMDHKLEMMMMMIKNKSKIFNNHRNSSSNKLGRRLRRIRHLEMKKNILFLMNISDKKFKKSVFCQKY